MLASVHVVDICICKVSLEVQSLEWTLQVLQDTKKENRKKERENSHCDG